MAETVRKSELRDELLHDITGLDTVEYLKVGRPARLKLPPVAILTFRTEKDAAAAYTYRAQSVPLVPLHQHAPNAPPPAGHLSIRKHAEQQQSYADRSLAVVRASSPDFVRKDKHACLQLLIKQTTHLYTQFGPNSPELNAFEFAEAALGIKPYQADYVHVQCTSVPGVHGLLAMDTIAFGTGLTVTFSAPLNHDAMAPSKTVDAFSLMVHEVSTGAAFGDVGNSLVTCIEQSAGCTLAQADHTGAKAVQVQGVRSKWSKLFLVKAATREDFLKVLELNGAQTFGPSLLKISTAASSLVGQSSYRDPNQAQAVRSALKSNSTYSQISHQAHLTNQPTAVSQAAPVVGMKEVLIRLDKMQQQNHSLEGEIRKVGTAVHESKSDVLQAVHAGTAATGEVFTAIQAVADTQTTESGATQLQLQAMSKLSKKVDSLGGKVDQVSTNLVAATGVASKKTCQSIQEEMSLLRKQMNILSPTNPREKHAKIAIDNAHPVNLEAVSIAPRIYDVQLHTTQDAVAYMQTCTASSEQTYPQLHLTYFDAKTTTIMAIETSSPYAYEYAKYNTYMNRTNKCPTEDWNSATVPQQPLHTRLLHSRTCITISPYFVSKLTNYKVPRNANHNRTYQYNMHGLPYSQHVHDSETPINMSLLSTSHRYIPLGVSSRQAPTESGSQPMAMETTGNGPDN